MQMKSAGILLAIGSCLLALLPLAAQRPAGFGAVGASPGNVFWSPYILGTNGTKTVGTSQHLIVAPFYVSSNVTFTKILQRINTLDATNKYDLCVFNNAGGFGGSGSLVADLSADGSNGVTVPSTILNSTVHQTPVTLTPGWYTYGFTGNNTTGAVQYDSYAQHIGPYDVTDLGAVGTANGACPASITVPAQSNSTAYGGMYFALTQ